MSAGHPRTLERPAVILISPVYSYRLGDFVEAARALQWDVIVVVDGDAPLRPEGTDQVVGVDFTDSEPTLRAILQLARRRHVAGVCGTEGHAVRIAAMVSKRLGQSHNDPAVVDVCRNKLLFREQLKARGVAQVWYRSISTAHVPATRPFDLPFPCVLKPLDLSGSRGVIRVDSSTALPGAMRVLREVLQGSVNRGGEGQALVEAFVPGREFALEGLLSGGVLRTLALFEKPSVSQGPYFEETILTTPAEVTADERDAIHKAVKDAVAAVGLEEGPIHAEVRLNETGAHLLEVAPRTIGGLCSRIFRYGVGVSLEEIVLRGLIRDSVPELRWSLKTRGVMMMPVSGRGVFEGASGVDRARALPGIREVTVSARPGDTFLPPPYGDRYAGFIFAEGDSVAQVESRLWRSFRAITFSFTPFTGIPHRMPSFSRRIAHL